MVLKDRGRLSRQGPVLYLAGSFSHIFDQNNVYNHRLFEVNLK